MILVLLDQKTRVVTNLIGTKINSNSEIITTQLLPTPFSSITASRLGYYQGNGARLHDTVRPHVDLPQSQPPCVTDNTTLLYDCGNWAISAFWSVPEDAVSGVLGFWQSEVLLRQGVLG